MGTQKFGTHLEHLWAVAGSRSGRQLAVAGERDAASVESSQVHVYAKSKLAHLASFEVGGSIHALNFAAGDLLLAGGSGGEVHGFVVSGDEKKAVFSHRHGVGVGVTAIASDAKGLRVAVVDDSGHLAVYELEDQSLSERLRARLSPRPLRCAAFDSKSGKLAVGGDDGTVRVIGADLKLEGVREMPAGEGDKAVTALEFTGDGRIIAGCGDGSIRVSYLEGAADEEDRSRDEAHTGAVTGLVLGLQLTDEAGRERTRRLLSVGVDGKLKAWIHDTRRKPKTVELGAIQIRGLGWLKPYRAKEHDEGGSLVMVDSKRRVLVIDLDGQSSPADDVDRIASAFAELADDLKARKQEKRVGALETLAKLPEDSARVLLDRALAKDNKPEVRKRAAELIASGKRRRSRPALTEALGDKDQKVRFAALKALRSIEGQKSLAPVRAAANGKHADLRKHAVEQLPGLREVSPLVPGLIADRLKDKKSEVRTAALEALCKLEPAGSRAPLRTAYEQGPADVRIAALLKLLKLRLDKVAGEGALADPTGRDLFEDALDDGDAEVRETAFLLSIGIHPDLLARLRGTFKTELAKLEKLGCKLTDGDARAELGPASLEPLFAAMACRYADTALRGALSLAVLGDGRATGALLQLSREADAGVRKAVAGALTTGILAMPHDDRLAARLQWLLDDPDASVRTAVFENLQILASDRADAGALDLAELALGAASQDVRKRALQLLVEFGGSGKRSGNTELAGRADELLGNALDDEAAQVRSEAFKTLWAWHSAKPPNPQVPLTRGARSRHADIRKRVIDELERVPDSWADELLLELVPDQDAGVGAAAYEGLVKSKKAKDRVSRYKNKAEVYLAAMGSPRPKVRALGANGARKAPKDLVRKRLIELLDDEHAAVHTEAIETLDRVLPRDQHAWSTAFGSKFYGLRVRAAELCGKRRDDRALPPMRGLLTMPESDPRRPSSELRHRAARAMADVGDRGTIPFFVELLDDGEPLVREEASRGLATACTAQDTQILLAALSHNDLPVRSWIAEGLARLGDVRAVPVLVGTLAHDHRPIRLGAILSLAALGPDGARGLLRGLEDRDREILDLVFAIVVARDVARVRRGQRPDLMLAALASSEPVIRFAAARALEERGDAEGLMTFATELVGPPKPDRAGDMKKWPEEGERAARLRMIVECLASDDPSLRYAAARVLSLRAQALAFWREAGRLKGPKVSTVSEASEGADATVPQTNYEDRERRATPRRGWIRRLIGSARDLAAASKDAAGDAAGKVTQLRDTAGSSTGGAGEDFRRLVFGTYAGLVRQAPAPGAHDETHRVRRDSIDRLGRLAAGEVVGRDAVLPVLRRALSDPNHLVRRAAVAALRGLYSEGAVEPLGLCLQSSAADVGRAAIDELVQQALGGDEAARAMALEGVDAPNAEVRGHALMQIQKLFEADSLEPWFVALGSQHADLRLSVVDRLVDAKDERVAVALLRAMESDHDDLRLKAASALARRGDLRTLDVLAAFLRGEDKRTATRAMEAVVSLSKVRKASEGGGEVPVSRAKQAAAEVLAARLEDDPERTADRGALVGALRRVADPAGAPVLLRFVTEDDAGLRGRSYDALVGIARDPEAERVRLANGVTRQRYREALLLEWLGVIVNGTDAGLREKAARLLRDVDDIGAEALLARLLEDREETVRVAACEVLSFRAEWVEGATLDALKATLEAGRRELVLPAAEGMAAQGKGEAFQPLLLVLKAGFDAERRRAILALGRLGDRRALEDLELLLDPGPDVELSDEDRALAPTVLEALGAILPRLQEPEERDRIRETVERAAAQGQQNERLGALAGLRRAGDERSRALIEGVAKERLEPEAIRLAAIKELGELGTAAAASEAVLAELLSDNSQSLAKAAHKALEQVLPGEQTRTALVALRSKHAALSGPAASYLATHGDPEILVARMTEIRQDEVRQRLRRGLVRRGECPASLEDLLTGEAAAQRADAAWIVGAAAGSDQEGTRAKAAALAEPIALAVDLAAKGWRGASKEDKAAHERAWGASLWAATQAGVEVHGTVRGLLSGSGEVPTSVLAKALRYLGAQGDADDIAAIEPSLSHRDATVRSAAGAAIAALLSKGGDTGESAREVVDRLSVADQVAVAPVIEVAIRGAGGQQLLETAERRRLALPVLLGDARFDALVAVAEAAGKDPARLTAIASLGRLGTDQAVTTLQGLLERDGEDEAVRKVAYKALRRAQRGKTTTANAKGAPA